MLNETNLPIRECPKHKLWMEMGFCPYCVAETPEGRAAAKADTEQWNRLFAAEAEEKQAGRPWNWDWFC